MVIGSHCAAFSYGYNFTGEMAEYLIYNTALSDTNREAVTDYLVDKYLGPLLDGIVPLNDCSAVQAAGGQTGDFDGDCTVNLSDFAIMANKWLCDYDPM